jgi:T5SS/PEP-CTERM-associated repeat protein/autotransporter-associated beta strand protein
MTAVVPRTRFPRSRSVQFFARKRLLLASTALMVTLSQGAMADPPDEVVDGETRTIVTPTTYPGELVVGSSGAGTLIIQNGGTVTNPDEGTVGFEATGNGTVTVSGPGSSWTNGSELAIGWRGTGALTITDGGSVSNTNGFIGARTGGNGSVTVSGSGSIWTNSEQLLLGYDPNDTGSTGNLTINNGGRVSDTDGFIAYSAGSTSTVIVTGAGSTWANEGVLRVGNYGTVTLIISDGASVSNTIGTIGRRGTGVGTVTVSGPGSTWNNSDTLEVGLSGNGNLTVSNGGVVTVGAATNGAYGGTVSIASSVGSTGTLNIGAAEAVSAAAAGRIEAASVVFGAGTGTLVFNHTDTDYDFASDISGTGTIKVLSGVTTFSGDSSTFTGSTTIASGGALNITGSLGGGATAVTLEGGTLTNSGTIKGGTTSVFFATGSNTLNILPTAIFNGVVNYNNQIGNTTTFGAGSYSIDASNYNDALNSITLNNARQMVVLDNASSTGTINVVAIPAASHAAT